MPQIEPIDDYIEPQLIIQAKAKEIEKLTLKKDFKGAYMETLALQAAAHKMENWLWKHMGNVNERDASKLIDREDKNGNS